VTLDGCEGLIELIDKKRLVAGVAYVLRHVRGFVDMEQLIGAGKIGKVRTLTYEGGQYFPGIRPDYNNNYFSRIKTGGGVLFDFMTHAVNLFEWLNGREAEVSCFFDRLQLEKIETDDVGFITIKYRNGPLGHLQQDAFRRDYFFHVTVVGSEGTLMFEYERNRLGYFPAGGADWEWTTYTFERDDFFLAQALHFLKALDGEDSVRCTVSEAKWTLQVILAARQSAQEKRHIQLADSLVTISI
jgi:predicted dehydrogenase